MSDNREMTPEEVVDYYFHPTGIPESVIGRYVYPMLGLGSGYVAACFINYVSRRPILSGIQKHIIGSAVGYGIGEFLYQMSRKRAAERDAVLKHYVYLHYEDFIPEKRIKYKDVFQPWTPIR